LIGGGIFFYGGIIMSKNLIKKSTITVTNQNGNGESINKSDDLLAQLTRTKITLRKMNLKVDVTLGLVLLIVTYLIFHLAGVVP